MRIRKRLVTLLVLPSLIMLASLLMTNEDPKSRRQMLSIVLVYAAFVLLIAFSPFAGYMTRAPRQALVAGLLFFFPFAALGYFRLEGVFAQAANAASYDDGAVMWIVLPIIGLVLSIAFFTAGAIIGVKRHD